MRPCSSECENTPQIENMSLPDGVEESVWTELSVPLLGYNKRIIQIQTHFTSTPYIARSHSCPITDATMDCDSTQIVTPSHEKSDAIPLEMGVPYFNVQSANTQASYIYIIQSDDVCSTSVKVRQNKICELFFSVLICLGRSQLFHLRVIQI